MIFQRRERAQGGEGGARGERAFVGEEREDVFLETFRVQVKVKTGEGAEGRDEGGEGGPRRDSVFGDDDFLENLLQNNRFTQFKHIQSLKHTNTFPHLAVAAGVVLVELTHAEGAEVAEGAVATLTHSEVHNRLTACDTGDLF